MHIVVDEKALGGHFALTEMQQLFNAKSAVRVSHYTLVLNVNQPQQVVKDGLPLAVPAHHILSLSPGQQLQLASDWQGEHYVLCFNREFYCIELHDQEVSCNGLLFNGLQEKALVCLNEKEQHSFMLLIAVFKDELQTHDHIQAEMLRLLLKRFIIKTTRLMRAQFETKTALDDGDLDLLRQFNILLEKHFRQYHKVADYAELLFKSPKTLSNLFAKQSQKTPLQLIHERLVLEAKRQLVYTDKTAKEIAFDLGFEDPVSFNRLFKKLTALTPLQFKAEQAA